MEASSVLHQVMNSHSLDQVLATTCPKQQQLIHQPPPPPPPPPRQPAEKRLRPQPEQALRCPRCDSTNTKFCYYNNYSLSQPRYFCKGCRRYWTQGGTLRNVPVGGGCRKNKRLSSTTSTCSSSSSSPFSSSKRSPHDHQPIISTADVSSSTNPFLPTPPTPLALPFASFTTVGLKAPPSADHDSNSNFLLSTIPTMSPCLLDILRGGSLENAYQSLCSTTGGEQVPLLPLGEVGGGGNGAAVNQQEGCSRGGAGEGEGEGRGGLMMGLQWQVGGGEAGLVGLQKQQQLEPMEGGWEGPVEQRWA